jgi:hypothetical protein
MILLKQGAIGANVKVWQELLSKRVAPIATDGKFGNGTKKATIELQRRLIEQGADIRLDGVVDHDVWTAAGLSSWSARGPLSNGGELNWTSNDSLRPARQSTMLELWGAPAEHLSNHCQAVTNPVLKTQLTYGVNMGPFRVSGHIKAIHSLKSILDEVKREEPDLYHRLGTAGMLCCRAVRGSDRTWSNHSWGTAIDITIDGQLDTYGDGYCQHGLLSLARFFNQEGWYWGAEFQREDSMHFEAGEQLVRRWV